MCIWERNKKNNLYQQLKALIEEIIDIRERESVSVVPPTMQQLERLNTLKERKKGVVTFEETTWRLKSRPIWISEGR